MDNRSRTSESSLSYSTGEALLANGPEALHSHLSKRLEIALGQELPQIEVRFKNLSISIDMLMDPKEHKQTLELPTITHEIKNSLRKLGKTSKYQTTRSILHNINGTFKPGTLTLVLGQPGSGKSAFMKILSGRFPMTKQVHVDGQVTYNGMTRQELNKRLPQFVNYVTQRDYHFPTLTVKETLEFAHICCGGTEIPLRIKELLINGKEHENEAAINAMEAIYRHKPDVILQCLGLDHCQNTIVGNHLLRGVSGGERKRVTSGEMEFSAKFVTFLDEISTGLDSAATYDIIKTQRSLAQQFRRTVVIALLQPSPQVFDLFDEVLLLNKGRIMYHGPRNQVMEYFEQLGFKCPSNRDPADFLLDLGTPQQVQYQIVSPKSMIPRTSQEFADAFMRSPIFQKNLDQLDGPHDPALIQHHAIFNNIPEFHQSFVQSTKTLMQRQLKITLRNTAFIKGRTLMIVLMGILYSTVFYQLDPTNAQLTMGILFAAVLFLALGQASQIPTFMAAREIFYKQRGANFFRTSSYVLANSICQFPLSILETIVFGTMVYWMCGFISSFSSFLIFLFMLLITNLSFAASFFCLSSCAPDLHVAKPISLVMILFFVIFSGFIIPYHQIPSYFQWVYWINPISWCLRSLAINQYRSDAFNVKVYKNINYYQRFKMEMGTYSLTIFDVQAEKYWIGYGIIFMIASYIFFMTAAYLVLEYKRYESPEHCHVTDDETVQEEQYSLISTPAHRDQNQECVVPVQEPRPVIPVTISFHNIWYSVPHPTIKSEKLDLLKGVNGFARPRTITALMGSSGAGKTTLMDVIAGRKTGGEIRGEILLNGYPATDVAIRRCTGYCEQMDIHSEAATIREAITFSTFLRQGQEISNLEKLESVNECLELLDLTSIADQIIRGSSVEQMKRLTIGVEIAAQPSVLFLDEPTSGLDARSAKVIMDGVRKIANTGRTVLCTIHQPSSEVFQVFDSLLLLRRGGETVFFGELGANSNELVEYFEKIPHVQPLPQGYNPATWMLEVIGAGVGKAREEEVDFAQVFKTSAHMTRLMEALTSEKNINQGHQPLVFNHKRAASEWTQARFLIQRFIQMYWRTPSYNLTRMVVYIILALVFGLTFLNSTYETYQGINAGQGLVFITTIFVGIVAFNSVLPIASEERGAFYRERASQTYNALWYFIGSSLIEIPYVAISTLLFCSILYPMVGFGGGWTHFFYYWLNTAMHVLLQTYLGQLLAYAMPSVEVAAIIGVLMNSIFFLFMGFNPPAAAIPSGYKWLYHITPQRYTLEILSGIVFGTCPTNTSNTTYLGCKVLKGTLPPPLSSNMTIQEYVEKVFLIHHDNMWENFVIVLGFIVGFRILALLSLRYINYQKK